MKPWPRSREIQEPVPASARRFAAVIFDMDGVLVDSEPMHVDATGVL